MMRALYTAATGMIAQQTNVDNIANNLSNVNTVGYKEEKTEFKSLLYQTIQTKTTTANGENKPIPAQTGLGTRVASTTSIFTDGALTDSDSDTDFALVGDGFFSVRGADGETYYTRDGSFTWAIGPNGNVILTNSSGYPVLDTTGKEIALPDGISSGNVEVSSTGAFGYKDANGVYVSMNQSLGLYQFLNPAGLEKTGSNLYEVTDASGAAQNESTNANLTKTVVRQGYLEASNVNVATEMVNLIIAQRAYQLNSKAITTSDEMLEQANNLKR
jgi:flagellar basal-body rod protein FlgG